MEVNSGASSTENGGLNRKQPGASSRQSLKAPKAGSAGLNARPPRVAVVVETSTLFGRRLMFGIAQYIRETRPWSIHFTERSVNEPTPSWLKSWTGDGIISRITAPDLWEAVKDKGVPVLDLNEQLDGKGVPMISNDHAAVGRMAADHLLERGFRQFGFLGHSGHRWSDRRRDAFGQKVSEKDYRCSVYNDYKANVQLHHEGIWQTELDDIAQWVMSLPKPVGVMVCGDFRGVQLLNACRQANVAVPEQVAVISVGNDDVACHFSDPPLSSVVLNAWKMGYEAASLLDRMMRGDSPHPCAEILIPPLDIIVRQSSDITAIADPLVAKALHFIRENARCGINVEAVLRHLGVSRTTLQNHFRDSLHRSIHDVLIEARLTRVKELLIQTSLSVADISERCGFEHPEYLSAALKKHTGLSPVRYRQQYAEPRDR